MSEVFADIRKTFNTPPDANPWTWSYEQDGSLETVVVNQATALAAFNAVRSRFAAESISSSARRIGIQFLSSSVVEATILKSDDANPWSYQYRKDGHLQTHVVGIADASTAVNAVRDRYLAETFAASTSRIRINIYTQE